MHVPIPGAADGERKGQPRFRGIKVSRALAKTVTYEGVTAVSEFSVNYLFVRDLAAAAGLTALSVVIAPIVYYVHEKAWDYYDATKTRIPTAPHEAVAGELGRGAGTRSQQMRGRTVARRHRSGK